MRFIPINKPILGEEEKRIADEILGSGMLTDSSYEGGKFVREFESKCRAYLGAKHAIAVNSGTAALHATLLAYGIGSGDEVIVPSFTFVATANVVLACGARPIFADVGQDYNVSLSDVNGKVTRKTKAIIPVHLYGYPADMGEIKETADKKSLIVIEDAAQSLGAEYRGKMTGTLSSAGCFSLYSTKVITSGEGGMITTNDGEIADRLRMIRNHGMVKGYDTRRLGYNYRMAELQAAIASVQMDKLDRFIAARRRNASFLTETIRGLNAVRLTQNAADRSHVWYLYTLRIRKNRDRVQERLKSKGIGAVAYFRVPVHRTPYYRKLGYSKQKLPNTEDSASHVLSLPVHPAVTDEEREYIADNFKGAIKEFA